MDGGLYRPVTIDYAMPVIVLAPPDASLKKTVSNLQEVAARGGHLILTGSPHARDAPRAPSSRVSSK
ncbi:MAG: hypothetical protein ACXW3J_03505, partial [Methylocystis sp.]